MSPRTRLLVLFGLWAAALVVAGCGSAGGDGSAGSSTAQREWELVWSDDFDGDGLDPTKWAAYSGRYGSPPRLQLYRTEPANVRVADGVLIVRATHDPIADAWHSGMVHTNDATKPENPDWVKGNLGWKYGRFEVRAKLPYGRGLWPSIWMRPLDKPYPGEWPHNGEIDILEYLGPQGDTADAPTDRLLANVHYVGADGTNEQVRSSRPVDPSSAQDWHVYAVEWEQGALRFFIDGEQVHEVTSWSSLQGYPAPFDQRFDIIINLQIGDWAGDPDPADYPAQLEVDWVRVHQAR